MFCNKLTKTGNLTTEGDEMKKGKQATAAQAGKKGSRVGRRNRRRRRKKRRGKLTSFIFLSLLYKNPYLNHPII